MSLESTLERTNELLSAIVTILQTGLLARTEIATIGPITGPITGAIPAPAPAEAPKRRGRPPKTEASPEVVTEVALAQAEQTIAAAGAAMIQATEVLARAAAAEPEVAQAGEVAAEPAPAVEPAPAADATRYFLYEKHNTVYSVKPGEPVPNIPETVEVSREVYEAKKDEFQKNFQRSQPAAPTTTPAATPAPSTPAAPAVSLTPSAPQPAEVPFQKIIERITALNKSPEPGHGREGVMAILRKWLPDEEKPTVTKMQPLKQNAAILADIEALLTPAPVADADDFDPLA